jgi:hypothetical protein
MAKADYAAEIDPAGKPWQRPVPIFGGEASVLNRLLWPIRIPMLQLRHIANTNSVTIMLEI